MDMEITKTCYVVLYMGMGNVEILPCLYHKGHIVKDVGACFTRPHIKPVTTEELKTELLQHKVGVDFLEGTNYEYQAVTVQAPHSALVPVGCFEMIE